MPKIKIKQSNSIGLREKIIQKPSCNCGHLAFLFEKVKYGNEPEKWLKAYKTGKLQSISFEDMFAGQHR